MIATKKPEILALAGHLPLVYGDGVSHDRKPVIRPWGDYVTVYEQPGLKAKVIRLKPRASIPNQYHEYHDEHWLVLAGSGALDCGMIGQTIHPGQMVDIPIRREHMVTAGPDGLTFLEIQVALIVPGGDAVMVD